MLCSRIVIAQGNFQSRRPQHAGCIVLRLLEKFWGVSHVCPEARPQKFEKKKKKKQRHFIRSQEQRTLRSGGNGVYLLDF